MPDASLVEIMAALAGQIEAELCGTADPLIENLQVEPLLVFNPTPPAIDVYPAEEFQEGIGFGPGNNALNFTVRARVGTAEHEGGQELILSMMDSRESTSVALAILSDRTLGGVVERVNVEGPSNYAGFIVAGSQRELLGCTWLVRVIP